MAVPRVAVVGGGIFGVTTAVELARSGLPVDLFEQQADLLMAASGINQYRVHRGYHYPRSKETSIAAKEAEAEFLKEYGEAVLNGSQHFYAISRRDSLTSADAYLEFCNDLDLNYVEDWPVVLKRDSCEISLRVEEKLFDPGALKDLCYRKLRCSGVRVYLNSPATKEMLDGYDFIVLATYAALNKLVAKLDGTQRVYQFEVCEKPVIRLPDQYRDKSIVVMDGPFMCIDPLGSTGLHVMGNVVHAIHHSNVGFSPEIPDEIGYILNRGIVRNPLPTKFDLFIEAAAEFFKGIEKAEHVGSMYTVRTVLPGLDSTDARPTLVNKLNDRVASIYSGKIGTCVQAANEVVSIRDVEQEPAMHK